ncbi:Uncharacterised protein [Salmonella enterica subsp. enterica]|uniref:Uncharacterized protein n=1 Tax=Salmonella enterica I TaxID=59201 RepID=A0A379WT70_SALET|nr:Uncharacterised protein [Salmonella enterica subsp. enterica]
MYMELRFFNSLPSPIKYMQYLLFFNEVNIIINNVRLMPGYILSDCYHYLTVRLVKQSSKKSSHS